MTGYQFLPPLTDAEYEALRGDIAANGMRHPIIVDEKGKILDGHHRARIAAELGFKPEREVAEGLTDQEKRDLAFTLNAARRHMDGAQRRAAVIASLKADPQLSDRQHARRTGVTHPTVAGIRAELVAKGDVESLSTRTDTAGRQQPAHRDRSPGEAAPALVRPATGSEEPTPGSAAAGGAAASESPGGIDAPPGAGANVPETPARRDTEPTQGESAVATTGGPVTASIPEPERVEQKPNRRPLPDAFRDGAYDLVKVVERLERLVLDDRFPRNAEQVARTCRHDLLRAVDLLAAVVDRLPNPTKESTE